MSLENTDSVSSSSNSTDEKNNTGAGPALNVSDNDKPGKPGAADDAKKDTMNIDEFKKRFFSEKHREFIVGLEKKTDTFEFHVTEHLRMSGAYWGATALHLLGRQDDVKQEKLIEWILQCQHDNGEWQ
jgi:prenyltransferase beta subunit